METHAYTSTRMIDVFGMEVEGAKRDFRLIETTDPLSGLITWELLEPKVELYECGDAENGPDVGSHIVGYDCIAAGMGPIDTDRLESFIHEAIFEPTAGELLEEYDNNPPSASYAERRDMSIDELNRAYNQ